jgi:hypothetical protein
MKAWTMFNFHSACSLGTNFIKDVIRLNLKFLLSQNEMLLQNSTYFEFMYLKFQDSRVKNCYFNENRYTVKSWLTEVIIKGDDKSNNITDIHVNIWEKTVIWKYLLLTVNFKHFPDSLSLPYYKSLYCVNNILQFTNTNLSLWKQLHF